MCGRYTLKTPAAKLVELLRVPSLPQLAPRFNIAPTQLVLCVRSDRDVPATREAVMMKWGLIPFWAKDQKIGSTMINARSETIAEKPAFRAAFGKRRCLIIADGFYEWEKLPDGSKQPWYIQRPDGEAFAFAGVWETWTPKPADPPAEAITDALAEQSMRSQRENDVQSCSIITTTANGDMTGLHDRMPVILPIEVWAAWLNPQSPKPQLQQLLLPLPDDSLTRFRVSKLVNRPSPDSPECIEPVE